MTVKRRMTSSLGRKKRFSVIGRKASVFCSAFTRHQFWGTSIPRLKPGVKHG